MLAWRGGKRRLLEASVQRGQGGVSQDSACKAQQTQAAPWQKDLDGGRCPASNRQQVPCNSQGATKKHCSTQQSRGTAISIDMLMVAGLDAAHVSITRGDKEQAVSCSAASTTGPQSQAANAPQPAQHHSSLDTVQPQKHDKTNQHSST